ncbi:hypothetical protein [Flavicella sp.]|uniref:hypothetical protein n=1 Tax=Flavicella sp. TaxID=2957742 RepID=UPI0030191A41
MAKRKTGIEWLLVPRNNSINHILKYKDKVLIDFYNKFTKNHIDANHKAVLWAYYNYLLNDIPNKTKNIYELNKSLSSIYFAMSNYRIKHEKTIDTRLKQLAIDSELKSIFPLESYKMEVVVITKNNCCSYCDSFKNNAFNYEYAMNNEIVDVSKCQNKIRGFVGTLGYRPKRDSNGHLIEVDDFISSNSTIKKKSSLKKLSVGCLYVFLFIMAINTIIIIYHMI